MFIPSWCAWAGLFPGDGADSSISEADVHALDVYRIRLRTELVTNRAFLWLPTDIILGWPAAESS